MRKMNRIRSPVGERWKSVFTSQGACNFVVTKVVSITFYYVGKLVSNTIFLKSVCTSRLLYPYLHISNVFTNYKSKFHPTLGVTCKANL